MPWTLFAFLILVALIQARPADACGGWLDVACNVGKAVEKAGQDTGKTVEKAAQDTGKTVEKAAQDSGKTVEKAAQDSGKSIEKAIHDAGYALEDAGQGVVHFFTEVVKQWAIFECRTLEGNNKTPDSPEDDKNKNNVSDKFENCMAEGSSSIGISGDSDGISGFYFEYEGQRLNFTPNEWSAEGRTPEQKQKESLESFEEFKNFVETVSPDESKNELSQVDGLEFEGVWTQGIKGMLSEIDPIGKSMPKFLPPNGTGLIRGNDGYASTGGSFLSLRGGGKNRYFHSGVDYVMSTGDPVLAGVSGEVIHIGCAYCAAKRNPTKHYKTVWIKTDNGFVVRYLYVSPNVKKGDRVKSSLVIGSAQNLEARYPPKESGSKMENHVHVQITDPEGKWVSSDGSFQTSKNKRKIEKAGDFYAEELLRIQGMLNHLKLQKRGE